MTGPTELLDIGEVIDRSGVPASTLHLWERAGLIESTSRVGLRRQYHADVMTRISIVVVSKRAGFTLTEIAELLSPEAFHDDKDLLTTKLRELRDRRAELDAAIEGLEHALACPHPSPMDCAEFLATLPNILPIETTNTPKSRGRSEGRAGRVDGGDDQ